MSDDDTTESTPAAASDDTSTSSSRSESRRDGVSVPSWLAAALVVLLGIAIGGAGFALGRATDGDDGGRRGERPIVAVRPGPDGRGGPTFQPGPGGGGPGELPFPGGRDDRGEDREDPTPEDGDADGTSLFGI